MVSTCSTCGVRIITASTGRWYDPVAAVNPVTAFIRSHRCGTALHTPNTSKQERLTRVVDTPATETEGQ